MVAEGQGTIPPPTSENFLRSAKVTEGRRNESVGDVQIEHFCQMKVKSAIKTLSRFEQTSAHKRLSCGLQESSHIRTLFGEREGARESIIVVLPSLDQPLSVDLPSPHCKSCFIECVVLLSYLNLEVMRRSSNSIKLMPVRSELC